MEQTKKTWQAEDAALKTTMQFFADELLPYFHIEGKVIGFGPTELVRLELQKLFQDFNLIMEDGSWKQFDLVPEEAETRDGQADYTGRVCVIGTDLKEDDLMKLFYV